MSDQQIRLLLYSIPIVSIALFLISRMLLKKAEQALVADKNAYTPRQMLARKAFFIIATLLLVLVGSVSLLLGFMAVIAAL